MNTDRNIPKPNQDKQAPEESKPVGVLLDDFEARGLTLQPKGEA